MRRQTGDIAYTRYVLFMIFLLMVLPVAAERRLKKLGTSNVDAYDAYLRGIDYLRQPPDETSLLFAEGHLKEALAIDPDDPSQLSTKDRSAPMLAELRGAM